MALFHFDHARARSSIVDPDGAIWPVNSFSNADELNSLFEVAVESGVIASRADARIHIYPLSISEAEPILALDLGSGPSLLGYSLRLRERDGENPVAFTLRLLEETTTEANALAGQAVAEENQPSEPADALRRFISAAQALDQAWTPALHVEGYPPYLPSFDQFAAEIASLRFKAPRGG